MHIHIENKMFSSICENQTTKTSIKSMDTAMQNDPLLNNMQSYELTATTNKFKWGYKITTEVSNLYEILENFVYFSNKTSTRL